MTLQLRRGRRSPVNDAALEPVLVPNVAALDQDLVASAGASWVSRAVLMACLVAGPLALAVATVAVFVAPDAAPVRAAGDTSAAARAQAGEFGVRVVTAWLGSTREDNRLSGLIGGGGDQTVLGSSPVPVADLQVAAVEPAGEQAWSVTVAGTMAAAAAEKDELAEPGAPAPLVRRYFQVPVVVAESGGMTSLALPSVVPGPALVSDRVELDYPTAVPTSSVLGTTSSEFLTALLTGVGDVTRYVSPGVTLATDTTPTFTAVKVSAVVAAKDSSDFDPTAAPADHQTVRVMVSGAGSVGADQSVPLQYALTFTGRAGRWEVSQVDPAPKWRVTASSASDAPTAAESANPKENS